MHSWGHSAAIIVEITQTTHATIYLVQFGHSMVACPFDDAIVSLIIVGNNSNALYSHTLAAVGGRPCRKEGIVEGEEKEKESYEAKWRKYLVAVSFRITVVTEPGYI